MVLPVSHPARHNPAWQVSPELQDIPHPPQLSSSVMMSRHCASQARRSEGQNTVFVEVGLVRGVSGIVALSVRFSVTAGVGSGVGVSTTTKEVVSGTGI